MTAKPRILTTAQRGYIIQRVLVDGLSPSEVARLYGVEDWQIEAWIAAYRRHGMGSLRHDPYRSLAARLLHPWLSRPLRTLHRLASPLFALSRRGPPASPTSLLRRSQDDRRGGP